MIDYIETWLQNLAYYMIFTTMILQIVPDREYRKYVKFLCGLVLILMMTGPVSDLIRGCENDTEKLYDIYIEEIFKTGE